MGAGPRIGRIERLRRRADLTCTELAARAGITRKTLRAIERGRRTSPDIAARLAAVLGPEVFDLVVRPIPDRASPVLSARLARGLTRADAAKAIGVSYGALRRAEWREVTPANALLIAAYYGLDVADVLPEQRAAA
jgi:DNA-binding XRE family transcriptional regulator